MSVTKEMIGAAHDIMLLRGDFVLSANLLQKVYLAMRAKEPMENRELVERTVADLREQLAKERQLHGDTKRQLAMKTGKLASK